MDGEPYGLVDVCLHLGKKKKLTIQQLSYKRVKKMTAVKYYRNEFIQMESAFFLSFHFFKE